MWRAVTDAGSPRSDVEPYLEEIRRLQDDKRALEARVGELQEALHRKCILDNYGITIENVKFDRWLEVVLSNTELEKWFGEPLPSYIIKEFDEHH